MIDQILGRPSPTVRRSQVLLFLFFWIWRLYKGDGAPYKPTRTGSALGPAPSGAVSRARKDKSWVWRLWVTLVGRRAVAWIARINKRLKHFTPYQIILGTLTVMYTLRHISDIFGLDIPEPLANLYTRSYYRATYVNTALDAGFASAMAIRPKWLKDICSVLYGVYFLVYASEGDEVLRKFRALGSVEMLRTTWEKTNNPYIRLGTIMYRPRLPIVRHVVIPRPKSSSRANLPPVKAMLFFDGDADQLAKATQIVVDYPGGGFIAMGPECHEERLRRWAKRTSKPVLGISYGKAPEYPYPWAIEEGFDAYRTLMETKGSIIGIKSGHLEAVLTGDSAGGNICATIMFRILEHRSSYIPRPVSIILAYPCLDFNFTSWMSPANLKVLRTEKSETGMSNILQGKDHMRHKSPLSVVDDVKKRSNRSRQSSWGQAIGAKLSMSPVVEKNAPVQETPSKGWTGSLSRSVSRAAGWLTTANGHEENDENKEPQSSLSETSDDYDSDDDGTVTVRDWRSDADKSLKDRVKTPRDERRFEFPVEEPASATETDGEAETRTEVEATKKKTRPRKKKAPLGTRLTMTSRVGYFQDRIISPSMMRAMAILYVGPRRNPDFETDYYLSPVLAPPHLLAHFPPVYLICGERDPFVDDTIIFAGKIREAKRARRANAEAAQQRALANGTPIEPDHILRETEDDWVQIRIIEGWGHGFMQMSSLMREVDSVLVEMADWIDESFERHSIHTRDVREVAAARRAASAAGLSRPEEHIPPPASTHVKPVGSYKPSASGSALGGADLGAPLASESGGDDEDGHITFTPKTRRRLPPPSKFTPVPRRASMERLLHRSDSAPKFDMDVDDEHSAESSPSQTLGPPFGSSLTPAQASTPRGSGAFAFFHNRSAGQSSTTTPPSAFTTAPTPPVSLFGPRRLSSNNPSPGSRPTNPLVAAAAAGARAASPALVAAGLVPQSVESVSEAEVMRRRRLEAVVGLAGNHADDTDDEDEDDDDDDDDGDEQRLGIS